MAFFEGIKMTAGYGDGPDIISSCNINANRGEIVAILGPNGAGKSTAMKAMLGLLTLKSGSVCLDGEDISKMSPQDRVKKGISFVPQTKNVFAELTVRENLEIGGFLREDGLEEMINNMQAGSVIYDLAAVQGGNTAFTKADEITEKNGVKIMGERNILNKLPISASTLYSKNRFNFVSNLVDKKTGKININQEDEIIEKTLIKQESWK